MEYLSVVIALIAVFVFFKIVVRQVIILEYEKGLKYTKGTFKDSIGPGQY
ncbi:MAG: hypothetical protein SWO11_04490 [Thermodesulfobacteriota bacterium]|nr:hypothetical protein [Thermodesulfobacteriota bacterium]